VGAHSKQECLKGPSLRLCGHPRQVVEVTKGQPIPEAAQDEEQFHVQRVTRSTRAVDLLPYLGLRKTKRCLYNALNAQRHPEPGSKLAGGVCWQRIQVVIKPLAHKSVQSSPRADLPATPASKREVLW